MSNKNTTKVIVGMSGGVDSSVAALLLKQQGYHVTGVTMRIWDERLILPSNNHKHSCLGPDEEQEINQAKRICDLIGIPFMEYDLRKEYKSIVLDYFKHEYLSGRTPNPCVICNAKIKFNSLLNKVFESNIEFDFFATGHYAIVKYNRKINRYLLKKGKDDQKDQSYFLFKLTQTQLSKCLFPLGNYKKSYVMQLAGDNGFGLEDTAESQNFISGDYTSLINTEETPGYFITQKGEVLGKHNGISHYTIGQRRGLGISHREPLYVLEINKNDNVVVVGTEEELYKDELVAGELNWIAMEQLQEKIEVETKIRYKHKASNALLSPLTDNRVSVKFSSPQKAITPGQAVVFYHKDLVVGGGIIQNASST
jgi:tRNA-specific 2-thiouridylase